MNERKKTKTKNILVAGTHSGCGKTTVTLAIMAALTRRGLAVAPFKCGPDFIDPSLHQMMCGQVSRNLDPRMCGKDYVRACFARHRAGENGCSVIEGVMGLFDGGEGSAAFLAKTLDVPVILVIDVRSAAESVAAIAKGFVELDSELRLAGIICNRVGSEKHRDIVLEALRKHCAIPVIGCLPRRTEIHIPSRHLGLHMGEENPLGDSGMEALALLAEEYLDLDLLLRLAETPRQQDEIQAVTPRQQSIGHGKKKKICIAVARDPAFCFYYEDNLDLLRDAGAELIFFSPLQDSTLPAETCGLYLGGGYPELYAKELGENVSMLRAIREFSLNNFPIYAECGGLLYLCQSLQTLDGRQFPMAGIYPFTACMQKGLRSLGYRQAAVQRDCLLATKGQRLHGHEFHYSHLQGAENSDTAFSLEDGRLEGHVSNNNTLAGYLHLHWGKTPEVAASFVRACALHEARRKHLAI